MTAPGPEYMGESVILSFHSILFLSKKRDYFILKGFVTKRASVIGNKII